MSTTQVLTRSTHLAGARGSRSKEDCMKLYDEWAATYNDDLADASENYVAPILTAQTALRFNNNPNASILDAGCGTGLVAEALAVGGVKTIDGIDLSPAMLKVADKTGVYRKLTVADMTQPIDKEDGTYDVVTCCGTFTHGHVGPDPALDELVRVIKTKGIIVATVLDELWAPWGFKAKTEKLEAEGKVKVLSQDLKDYRKGFGDKAVYLVLEKL